MHFRAEGEAFRLFSPLIAEDNGLLLDDLLQFSEDGQFHLMGRRGRIVKIEEKRMSLQEVEQRLLALDGIREAAAVPLRAAGVRASAFCWCWMTKLACNGRTAAGIARNDLAAITAPDAGASCYSALLARY